MNQPFPKSCVGGKMLLGFDRKMDREQTEGNWHGPLSMTMVRKIARKFGHHKEEDENGNEVVVKGMVASVTITEKMEAAPVSRFSACEEEREWIFFDCYMKFDKNWDTDFAIPKEKIKPGNEDYNPLDDDPNYKP